MENPMRIWMKPMAEISILGWVGIISIISIIASLFVAQAADGERNKPLFLLANIMTGLGVLGLLVSWLAS